MKTTIWNLFRGCHKISSGCKNCYIALGDLKKGKDFDTIEKTPMYDRLLRKNKKGDYVIPSGTLVYTAFSSDFLLEDIDSYRDELWDMIHTRKDLQFMFLTKRISRLNECLPKDWPDGYDHVTIGVSVENQEMADERLPHLLKSKIKHKMIICQPLIGPIDLSGYLEDIELVTVGGEASKDGRMLDDIWVEEIRKTCMKHHVSFSFRQAASHYLKDGMIHHLRWHELSQVAHQQMRDISFKDDIL